MPRTIHLMPDFEASLDRLVESGRYGGVNDVIMYAIAALDDREAVREARQTRFMAMIDEGLDDIEAGRTHDIDEVFAELDEIIARNETSRTAAE